MALRRLFPLGQLLLLRPQQHASRSTAALSSGSAAAAGAGATPGQLPATRGQLELMNDMGIPPSELKNITFDGAADIIKRQHDPFTQMVVKLGGYPITGRQRALIKKNDIAVPQGMDGGLSKAEASRLIRQSVQAPKNRK